MDLNQLMRQTSENYQHLFWGWIAITSAALLISGLFFVAIYGLAKRVCEALVRFLHAKASAEEEECRKRQVWHISKQTPEGTRQDSDYKYRPKD